MVLFRTDRSLVGSDLKKGVNGKIKGQGQGQGQDSSLSAMLSSPEILDTNPVSQLSMPAIEHLSKELNVRAEEVVSGIFNCVRSLFATIYIVTSTELDD